MNIHILHIDPYDLAFLCLVITGLNFALLLAFSKRINHSANRFLALALVVTALWIICISVIDIQLPLQFSLAIGPLIYFYVLKLTQPEYKFTRKEILHFIPAILGRAILPNPVSPLLTIVSVASYLYCSHLLIQHFYSRQKFNCGDRYRCELRWLHRLLIGFGILLLLWMPYAIVGYFYHHYQIDGQFYYLFYLCTAAVPTGIAMAAYLKPEIGVPTSQPALLKPLLPAELKQKGAWLKNVVKTNRYYHDPELSLSSLADKLGLTTHELSRILNTALKKSFNDFINEFRVTDVIRKMQNADYGHITLLGIALDSGFNSQSTFTRIFKQMTGKSPMEYKNGLKKDCPSYNLGSSAGSATVVSHHKTTFKWSDEKLNRNYMFKNYLKVAFRNFWRHKLFTLINIVGLSIGTSAALVIYLLVHYDLTFDTFHKDGDRIYRVVTNFTFQGTANGYNAGVCGPLPWAVKEQAAGLQAAAPIFSLYEPNVVIPNGNKISRRFKEQDNVILADSDYFKIFTYHWLAGSAGSALMAPYRVVLTSEQAEKYFPGLSYEQMLGRTVVYDSLKTTVSGIVQTIRQNTDLTFRDFVSFPTAFVYPALKQQLRLYNWGGVSPEYQFFVKLTPGATTAGIEKQLNDIENKNVHQRPGVKEVFALQPLADIHFNPNYLASNGRIADKTTLIELAAIALFLLLLGCINFINLTTAQSAQRAKEIGIRKTLGSNRNQLVFQFLSETFLLTLVSVIVSVSITPAILNLFSGFIPEGVHAGQLLQPNIILFLVLLAIIVSIASGFYPAMVLSGYKPVSAIKNQANEHSSKTRTVILRKSLTVVQFAIAQFFIIATIVVSKQIYYAVHKDLGFKKDAILIVNSPWKNRQQHLNQVLLNKFKSIPQVNLVSMGRDAPSSDDPHSTEGSYRDGKKEMHIENLGLKFGDENYIKVYHIKLLAGRNLIPGDTTRAFLINNTLAKLMGFKDPHDAVGKTISKFNGDKNMQIVGVVADFNQESIHAAIEPLAILTSTEPYFNGTFHIALKPQTADGDGWKTTIASMEKSWKQVYPDDDFEYQFFDESIAKLYANEQKTSALLGWATGLSILISCLGLLGLAIYTINQRTKEIGVRKVLGATVSQIVVLLSTEMAWLIILAFVIISPVAWWTMNKWMQSFADKTIISWWIFALSGGGMLLTALFTSGFQTIKAALGNPVDSLRSE
ncbi:MAG TPA: ABC transporter permease [Mucilaginibacter sp.]|nr:ABC transporter permease [Mucilaginibacter sp.]